MRLAGPSAVSVVMPAVRALLHAECAGVHRPKETPGGWAVDICQFDVPHEAGAQELTRRYTKYIRETREPIGTSVLLRPRPAQRNRVRLSVAEMTREVYEQLDIYREVAQPCGLGDHHQLRVLLCEGSSLIAWFGVFSGSVSARDHRVLAALAPAMRTRLSFDRRVEDAPLESAALDATLELLAVPTFVLGRHGAVHEANTAGRALLDSSGDVARALRDAALRRPCGLNVGLTPIRGDCGGFIAMIREAPDDLRRRCALARLHWTLTPRQAEVLACLADGQANAAIAATLGTALRTVEFHVTALFDRAGVHTRSGLVAALLALRV